MKSARITYNILLVIYNILLVLLYIPAGIIGYLKTSDKSNYFNRLGLKLPAKKLKQSFWFHAASVGEVKSLNAIISELKQKFPDMSLVVSTMTETGLQAAKDDLSPDIAFLIPIENRFAIKAAVKRYNTKVFFITDTEIWPNLISSIPKSTGLFLLNGRISDHTIKTYLKYSFLFAPILQKFTYIFAKSSYDAERFKAIAKESTVVTGANIKYIYNQKQLSSEIANLKSGRVALAASTHAPEEEFFLNALKAIKDNFEKIIIVPRHINRSNDILNIAKNYGYDAVLYSNGSDAKLIIVDKIGLLEQFYQIADSIFVGGSIANIGGHNLFEAFQYNKKVCTGPNMYNFLELTEVAERYSMITYVATENEMCNYFKETQHTVEFSEMYLEIKAQQTEFKEKLFNCIHSYIEK